MSQYPPSHRTPPREPCSTFDFERLSRVRAEIANENFVEALKRYFANGGRA